MIDVVVTQTKYNNNFFLRSVSRSGQLELKVQHREFSSSSRIGADGYLLVPLLGTIDPYST